MSVRGTRRLLFAAFFLALPLPMLGPFDTLVPPVRYAILSGAAGAVALVEGASGPVPGILALFAAHALGATALAWLAAWGLARGLSGLSDPARRGVAAVAVAALLAVAASTDLYRTGFGRTPTASLFGVLH